MTRSIGSFGRFAALSLAILVSLPLFFLLAVLPAIGWLGLSAETAGTFGWIVVLAVAGVVGYGFYRGMAAD